MSVSYEDELRRETEKDDGRGRERKTFASLL